MLKQAVVTFLYPRTSTSHFDMKYYLTSHIPTCKNLWEPKGMSIIYVCNLDVEQIYMAKTIIIWKDMESWTATSQGDTMTQLIDDMKNFTDVTPVTIVGTVVG